MSVAADGEAIVADSADVGVMVGGLFSGESAESGGTWSDLGAGAPTLSAFASLCRKALASGELSTEGLSLEARTILFAARSRGVFEIKGANDAFEAPARFLAVRVEQGDERWLVFRSRKDPAITIRFLDGFRELCAAGLVMHHLYRDFSLTRAGFEAANSVPQEEIQDLLDLAAELSRYE